MTPAATVSSTRPRTGQPAKQQFSERLSQPRSPSVHSEVEVEQRDAGGLAHGDSRRGQPEQGAPRGHPFDERPEVQRAGHHEPRVERGEGALEAGRTHRRLLERDLLLLARVRRVVGRDAVDRAVAQGLARAPRGRSRRRAAGSSSCACRGSARPPRSAAGGGGWPRRSRAGRRPWPPRRPAPRPRS